MKIIKISKVTKSAALEFQTQTQTSNSGGGEPPIFTDEDFRKVDDNIKSNLLSRKEQFKKHQEKCDVCSSYDMNHELCSVGWAFINGKTPKTAKKTVCIKLAKKKKVKTPKQHGFIEECIKKNKDKDSPGGYFASIVDKVKGNKKWRKKK